MNKIDKVLAFMEFTFYFGEIDNKYTTCQMVNKYNEKVGEGLRNTGK